MDLDQETRDKIIETHTNVAHIINDLENGKEQFKKLDTRIRRIENLFLPVVTLLALFANKVWTWLKI